ncbi:DUF2249 domain-containing protein [Polaromonas naphthalenivorans]|uniref:DUF2249 domain-containing protein n=1 Tax=Polaromonas naphthalenivorans (strain CJ2) TaxID=365044 RepID=A1VUD6_POLNA|nr:DUF2249 domain-containing protein [Polaromonas naphthalenivorans]ABM39264.1 conserved hypothetical protein [Polaromonas naphthalenivorans CJ2]
MTACDAYLTMDVRQIAPPDRHSMIFAAFKLLGPDEIMELISDHDPQPLKAQFQFELPGQFSWVYLEQGPATWRVAINRLKTGHGSGGCCGGCGGGA